MKQPILITYATRFGSTAEIAKTIGTILEHEGQQVEVRPVEEVTSLDGYGAVLLGSAIRGTKWLPEAVDFLAVHHAELSQLPVAYFTLCLTLQEDTAENRRIVQEYHAPLLQDFSDVCPVSIGMFAGRVDFDQFALPLRLMAKAAKIPEGDWRNWDEIENWARDLVPLLEAQAS